MKKENVLPASLVFFAVLALSGCSLYGGTSTPNYASPTTPSSMPTSTTTSTQQSMQGATVASNVISIQNFSFSPATLTVKKGTTVTWTNNDSVTHQIKSNAFNSSPLSSGQSFSFTFNTAGTFDYSCAIHPSMTGQIIVQ